MSELPLAARFKPKQPYRRCIADRFKDLPAPALSLIETLLSIDPAARLSAAHALNSEDCAVGFLFALLPILGGTSGVLQGVISMTKSITLVLGPPGCAKTSLLKALSGNLDKSLKFYDLMNIFELNGLPSAENPNYSGAAEYLYQAVFHRKNILLFSHCSTNFK